MSAARVLRRRRRRMIGTENRAPRLRTFAPDQKCSTSYTDRRSVFGRSMDTLTRVLIRDYTSSRLSMLTRARDAGTPTTLQILLPPRTEWRNPCTRGNVRSDERPGTEHQVTGTKQRKCMLAASKSVRSCNSFTNTPPAWRRAVRLKLWAGFQHWEHLSFGSEEEGGWEQSTP